MCRERKRIFKKIRVSTGFVEVWTLAFQIPSKKTLMLFVHVVLGVKIQDYFASFWPGCSAVSTKSTLLLYVPDVVTQPRRVTTCRWWGSFFIIDSSDNRSRLSDSSASSKERWKDWDLCFMCPLRTLGESWWTSYSGEERGARWPLLLYNFKNPSIFNSQIKTFWKL